MNLQEFLRLPHRFRWGGEGGDDCTTFCASWVQEQTGTDPALMLRGTYRDSEGAHALLAAAGGLLPFMARHLEPLGYARTNDPQDGDIGAVLASVGLDGEAKEVGAIRFGPLWAILGPARVVTKQAEFIAAWSYRKDEER